MGIGGLDSEFSDIFRRAFASRVFPPALVEKLGIQHVKGTTSYLAYLSASKISHYRSHSAWSARNGEDPHRETNWQNA